MKNLHETMTSLSSDLAVRGRENKELKRLLENNYRVLNRIDNTVQLVRNGDTTAVPMDWSVRR